MESINNFGLTDRDIDTLSGIFRMYPSVERVFIFGSRAKGTYKYGSDVDLAIMNSGVSEEALLRIKSDIEESSIPYNIDLVNFPALEHKEFIEHINRVGIVFYEKG